MRLTLTAYTTKARFKGFAALVLLILQWANPVWAHLVQVGHAQALLRPDGVMLFVAPHIDVVRFADDNANGALSAAEITAHRPELEAKIQEHIAIIEDAPAVGGDQAGAKLNTRPTSHRPAFIDLLASANGHAGDQSQYSPMTVVLFFPLQLTGQPLALDSRGLALRYSWFSSPAQPMRFVVAGGQGGQILLEYTPSHSLQQLAPSRWSRFSKLFVIGVEHIWFGADHLVFVLLLVLGLRGLRSWLGAVTAFTLGHSVTIFLAPYIPIASHWVELAIALSIVAMALGNLRRWRSGVTIKLGLAAYCGIAAIGLIHGLGFAGSLADSGVLLGHFSQTWLPLLGFNLGVETGQIAFLLLLALLFWSVRRASGAPGTRWMQLALSLLGLGAGVFWTVQRVL